jgi:O-acetyl-ADP-ribose deacetylase (regulator of RNase III)
MTPTLRDPVKAKPNTNALSVQRFIINFPTKDHRKAESRLVDIESGLRDLVRVIDELRVKSIALPPLGCGNEVFVGLR